MTQLNLNSSDLQVASLLAADLRGEKIDHNQMKSLLSYMRNQQNGRALIDYLHIILANEKVVRRSGQTPHQFQAILKVCERHLRFVLSDYQRVMQILGWTIRLMRYYKAVSEAAPRYDAQQRNAASISAVAPPLETGSPMLPKHGSNLLKAGEVFRGTIIASTKKGVEIQHQGHTDTNKVLGRIEPEHIKGEFKVNNTRWVRITRIEQEGRKTILWLKPDKKPEGL